MKIRTPRPQFKSTQTQLSSVEGRGSRERSAAPRPSTLGCRIAYERGSGRRRAAFTLIEIMVVVVILGVLAATLIPQFIGTTHDAKVSAAKAHVAELEGALERFYVHMDRYPTMDEGLKVLVEPPTGEDKKWRGPYIRELRRDPWGNPYQYRIPGVRHQASFDLWSRGADGADGGEGQGADIGNWGD
ncbi:MAG: type II secretion system major pseudopilin GspG [Verrucomicrobiota bacterium]